MGLPEPVGALVGLVLGTACPGCATPDVHLCSACRSVLRAPARRLPDLLDVPCWAGPDYAGPVAGLVSAWKDDGRRDLTRPLAGVLARAVRGVVGDLAPDPASGEVLLVPVPSSRAARRRRGGSLVVRLGLLVAADLRAHGVPARLAPVLRLARRVADQRTLTAGQRAANLAGAFAPRRSAESLLGRSSAAVVLDDVCTTGATLAEAVRALRSAAPPRVETGCAAAVATPLGGS